LGVSRYPMVTIRTKIIQKTMEMIIQSWEVSGLVFRFLVSIV